MVEEVEDVAAHDLVSGPGVGRVGVQGEDGRDAQQEHDEQDAPGGGLAAHLEVLGEAGGRGLEVADAGGEACQGR